MDVTLVFSLFYVIFSRIFTCVQKDKNKGGFHLSFEFYYFGIVFVYIHCFVTGCVEVYWTMLEEH